MPRKAKASGAKVPGWEHYFPIPRGRAFEVVLERPPFPVRGRGTVVKRTASSIHIRLEVKGGFLVPNISADLELTYSGEGGGNAGHLEVAVGARRESFDDRDVTIRSQPQKRVREIAPSVARQGRSARVTLHATGGGECRLSAQGFEIRLTSRDSGSG
ncbi:MAG TPA: hypothetical protein VIG99_15415 [Myxococcaceae bacterium]